MRILRCLAVVLVLALGWGLSGAEASQERIHDWLKVTLVAPTELFGDVEVKATGDAAGNVDTLAVTPSKQSTITVPARWLESLPGMRLSSLEVRSETGLDGKKWLYLVFLTGRKTKDHVHIMIEGGKVREAMITTVDARDNRKTESRKGP